MENQTINAALFAKCFLAGAKTLEADKEHINELNVFPVPDGDTGTNMTMTIMSAAREVVALEDPNMATLAKAISSGSLRGARGNSGVILSQLFRGFAKTIKTVDEITIEVLADAMDKAVETAYKAVMKPKEGTILTVAKGAAEKVRSLVGTTDDLLTVCAEGVAEAEAVLEKTPEMLPVLKQAGVVDSGGQGLCHVLRGGYEYLSGKEMDLTIDDATAASGGASMESDDLSAYPYQCQFYVRPTGPLSDIKRAEFQSYIENEGKNTAISFEKQRISVKLCTKEPGNILTKAMEIGSLFSVTIVNREEEAKEEELASKPASQDASATGTSSDTDEKAMGFIVVSCGEGLSEIFSELGADVIIEGGQTMNPSTDDILQAVRRVPAKTVFVLPNNKNIILAAEQAKKMMQEKEVIVIPTKTIPQGITALINFIPEQTPAENEAHMKEEIGFVKTGEITYAVRDTIIDDKEIAKGDYMGIGDKGILSVNKNIGKAFLAMLKEMVDEDAGIISMYYGADVTEKDAEAMMKKVVKAFPHVDVDLQCGGQPVYYYIASVE